MALTLEAEQRLENNGLVAFFEQHEAKWKGAAQKTYTFLKGSFPHGSPIRRDDLAKALHPILEVDKLLQDKLAEGKLKQKFWVSNFVDLIIDRVWVGLN